MKARPAWLGALGLVLGVALLSVAADFVGATGGTGLRLLAGLVVVAALVRGASHHGSGARSAWLLIALGIGGWVAADAVWDTFDATDLPTTSGWYDVVNGVYLCLYPVIFVALVRIVDARGRARRIDNVVDSAIAFLAAVLVLQILLINPYATGSGNQDWVDAAFPFADALLLAAIGWFVFTHGRRNPSAWLLGAGIVLLTGVDAAWETAAGHAWVSSSQWIDPLYPICYALIGAAVLHPAVAHLSDRVETRPAELHPARLGFLCAALATIPIAAFLGSRTDLLAEVAVTTLVVAVAVRLVVLVRNVHDAQQQAQTGARRFADLAAAAPVAILEADPELTIVFANEEAERFLGGSMIGMRAQELIADLVDDRDQHDLHRAVARVVDGDAASAQLRIRDAAGSQRWVTFSAVPVRRGPGPFRGAFVSITDITAIKDAEEMLTLQVTHDPLTGLPNRRMLLDRLTTAITRLNRVPVALAVLFLDLDGFKQVNDELGHAAGDELLEVVATRLLHTVRADDTVARLGGDEFVVVLERVPDPAHVVAVADKLLQAVRAPAPLAQGEVTVTASIGIATTADPRVGPDTLLHDADAAMYAAKRAGRGLVRLSADSARPAPDPAPGGDRAAWQGRPRSGHGRSAPTTGRR